MGRRVGVETYPDGVSVHASFDEWPETTEASQRLWRAETFEGNTHLADYSARDVVDEFWPAADGWTIAAAEPGFFSVLYVLRHPERGVAAMTLGTVEPGGGLATEADWDALSVKMRSRNTCFVYLAEGPSALAILTHFKAYQARRGGGRMRSGDENFVHRLLTSGEFMDAEAATMVALGAFEELVEVANTPQRAEQREQVRQQIAQRRETAVATT